MHVTNIHMHMCAHTHIHTHTADDITFWEKTTTYANIIATSSFKIFL